MTFSCLSYLWWRWWFLNTCSSETTYLIVLLNIHPVPKETFTYTVVGALGQTPGQLVGWGTPQAVLGESALGVSTSSSAMHQGPQPRWNPCVRHSCSILPLPLKHSLQMKSLVLLPALSLRSLLGAAWGQGTWAAFSHGSLPWLLTQFLGLNGYLTYVELYCNIFFWNLW